MPDETPVDPQPTEQPALTRGVIAGVISASVLFLAARINRSWEILSVDELNQFRSIVELGVPALAGWLISRHVVPVGKADRAANFFMAAGYAQGLDDNENLKRTTWKPVPNTAGEVAQGAGLKDQGGSAAETAQEFADKSLFVDDGFLAFIVPVKDS